MYNRFLRWDKLDLHDVQQCSHMGELTPFVLSKSMCCDKWLLWCCGIRWFLFRKMSGYGVRDRK